MNKHLYMLVLLNSRMEFVDVTNPPIPIRCLQYITYIYAVTQPHWNQDEMIDQVDVLTQHQQAIREFYWRGILTKLFAQYQSLNLSNQTLDGNNEYILACMWKSENIDVVELVDKLLPCLSNQTINNMKIIIESNFIQPCAICNEPITNQSPHQCIHHHTWKQCPLSLLLIDTPVIKTCSDCGLKYRWFQNQVFETQPITFLLMQLNTCVFCASTFKYSDLQLYR
ncbi:hypothetical protein BC833DRAFT_587743 [Globomyces pollinis-pini]|nr:hypothetical protein BC833DRAFT_587743 [Globomyces pollinis-pini]